jgi:hypothetical protein
MFGHVRTYPYVANHYYHGRLELSCLQPAVIALASHSPHLIRRQMLP